MIFEIKTDRCKFVDKIYYQHQNKMITNSNEHEHVHGHDYVGVFQNQSVLDLP